MYLAESIFIIYKEPVSSIKALYFIFIEKNKIKNWKNPGILERIYIIMSLGFSDFLGQYRKVFSTRC